MSHGNARVILLLAGAVVAAGLIALLLTGGLGGPDPVDPTPTGPGEGRDADLPPGARSGPGGVSGTVLVFGTNEPAAGIPVRIEGGDETIELATDEDGLFATRVPSGRNLVVRIDAEAPYAPIVLPGLRVKPGETESLGTLYLNPAFLVRGIVVDGTGKGVPGAEVRALRPTKWSLGANIFEWMTSLAKPRVPLDEAITDSGGAFTLTKLTPGTYRLEAEAEGFAIGAIGDAIVSPATEDHRFRIVLAPGVGLSGTVKNTSGDGIEGATVTTLRTSRAFREDFDFQPVQAVTDADGSFEFPRMAPGDVGLMVGADGYPVKFVESVELGVQETIDVVLGGTASIEGKVTGPEGEPVAGARVSFVVAPPGASFCATLTDADGRYRVERLSPGAIQFLFVEADGYATFPSNPGTLMGPRGQGVGTLEEGKTLVKDVELVKGATVSGVVTDRASGRPIAGARIRLLGSSLGFGGLGGGKAVLSDEEGRYRIEGAPAGRSLLLVSADGYFQPDVDPRMLFAPGQEPDPDPDRPILTVGAEDTEITKDLKMAPGATIVGTVLDPTGNPLAGAKVSLEESGQGMGMLRRMLDLGSPTVLTDREGTFRLSGAAAAENVVVVAAREGLVSGSSRPIRVETGQVVQGVEIRLREGGAIVGAVYGADGAPLAGASVRTAEEPEAEQNEWQLNWQLGQSEATPAGAEGRFRVDGLAPGRRIVKIEGPDHLPLVRRNVQVLEGGEIDLGAVRLDAGLAIAGFVMDARGDPVEDARVFANPTEPASNPLTQRNMNARTDEQGRFRIPALPPGDYHVSCRAEGFAPAPLETVAAGESGLRIVLEEGLEISGRVMLPDGGPAVRVAVSATDDEGSSRSTRTDGDGNFTLGGLPPGTYTLTAAANSFGPAGNAPNLRPARIEGVAAGTTDLLIRLEPGLTISGIVVDEDGAPLEGVQVMARFDDERDRNGAPRMDRSGEDGMFRVTGLEPGIYRIQAWGQGGGGQVEEVRAGATGVRVVLKPPENGPNVVRPR